MPSFLIRLVLILTLSTVAYETSLAQKSGTVQLEKRITDLEKRVAVLEDKLSTIQIGSHADPQLSKEKTVWRQFSKGLSKPQVKAVLGEPVDIEVGPVLTFWYYSKDHVHSYVYFDENGLCGWVEPQ